MKTLYKAYIHTFSDNIINKYIISNKLRIYFLLVYSSSLSSSKKVSCVCRDFIMALLSTFYYQIITRFLDVSSGQNFFDNIIGFMEIEYNVKFAHIAKVSIKAFDKVVDHFKNDKLIVLLVTEGDKIQTSITFVYNLELIPFDKI